MQESVVAILDALRSGIGAQALGLFDDDRAELSPLQKDAQLNFWEAFGDLPCIKLDWSHWYVELKANKSVVTACACGGAHKVQGVLIHDRWAMLMVVPAALGDGGAAMVLSAVKALSDKLPPAKGPSFEPVSDDEFGAGDLPTLPGGGPLWWVRKIRQ